MLKQLTKIHTPKFATLDDGKLFDGRTITNVSSPADLKSILTKKNRGLWIYGYDIEPYIQYAIANYAHKIISRNGDIIGLKIYFADNKNSVNLVNATYILPSTPPSLWGALVFMFRKLNPGCGCKWTVGAFSMDLFRRKYQGPEVLKGLPIYEEQFVRKSYAGGRIELLQTHMDRGFAYDVNSMYGWAMTQEMPTKQAVYVQKRNPDRIGFYKAEVDQTGLNIPPLWKKINGALCFPADKFDGIFPGAEIDAAIRAGARIKILYGMEWTGKKAVFKEFAEDIFRMKQEEKGYKSVLAKKMLVSLYGKFGIERQATVMKKMPMKEYFEALRSGGAIDENSCTVEQKGKFSKQKYILPYLASHITALCRVKLYDQIRKIELAGGHVSYCHTDSIFTDLQITSGSKMGEWGFEGVVEKAEFKGINTYKMELNGEIAVKAGGINADTAALQRYLDGKEINIKKKSSLTQEYKNYSVKLNNKLFKRKYNPAGASAPMKISEILDNM